MKPHKLTRIPSADWRTEDLHRLWSKTDKKLFIQADGSLHEFLQYCCLLKSVRHQFEQDDRATYFDGCCFFLRGGYFAFKYLNLTSSMALRATIFGGLHHGRHPKKKLSCYIKEKQDKAQKEGKSMVNLLIIDEVKSGTGMGTVLKLVKNAMNDQPRLLPCNVQISFYAIRPGQTDQMTDELKKTVNKWHGIPHHTCSGELSVNIQHFAGPLLGYDDDLLCGIQTQSKNSDPKEAYELVKISGGVVKFWCDSTKSAVFEADIGENCLVESLSNFAKSWTREPSSAPSINLAQNIEAKGCFLCKALYMNALGLP